MQALRISALLFLGVASGWSQTNGNNGAPAPPSASAQSPGPPAQSPAKPQPGQVLPDSTKLEPLQTVKAEYPPEAASAGIQGEVVVKVHVSETGDVDSAEVVSGEPALTKAALEAAKKWKFKPFIRNGKPSRASALLPFDFAPPENIAATGASASGKTAEAQPAQDSPAQSSASAASTAQSEPGAKSVQVAQGITQGMVIFRVQPVYPEAACAAGTQGTVVLNAVISKEGQIEKLEPISGSKLLVQAAVDAVQLWRYKPYVLAGEPVEVKTTITVNFKLSQ
jgi:TonB family protein